MKPNAYNKDLRCEGQVINTSRVNMADRLGQVINDTVIWSFSRSGIVHNVK